MPRFTPVKNAWNGQAEYGQDWAISGNLLTGPEVVDAMALAFEDANGTLAERMIVSYERDKRGGDKRGRQSAALLVVREGWGYAGPLTACGICGWMITLNPLRN